MTEVVNLSEAAAYRVKEMMVHNEEEGSLLRVSVNGGGCSGLSYGMGFEKEKNEDDIFLHQHDLEIIISSEDASILQGTVIDYKESLMGGGFTIDNPNAIASCGCGSSFRTAKKEGTPESC
ncbi:iron-sulfur cluster assembly accessory protein [Psychrobacillus sp. FSL K6-1267]|uniref:iron-sulfur cluster assembly accessory protein n=1 Tax=Psychrobacillus sp. FSL K6-1267 TaxID=2921543 RepID=UPI0011A8A1CB